MSTSLKEDALQLAHLAPRRWTASFSTAFHDRQGRHGLGSVRGAHLYFTVGAVRGFAFYLGLAALLDLVAFYFLKPVVALMVRSRRLGAHPSWFGIPSATAAPALARWRGRRRRRRRRWARRRARRSRGRGGGTVGAVPPLPGRENDYDFRKVWRIGIPLSILFVLISILSLFTRELNLGIDFEGGGVWEVPSRTSPWRTPVPPWAPSGRRRPRSRP